MCSSPAYNLTGGWKRRPHDQVSRVMTAMTSLLLEAWGSGMKQEGKKRAGYKGVKAPNDVTAEHSFREGTSVKQVLITGSGMKREGEKMAGSKKGKGL